jgi:predicted PurR-regulated permease PerM
LRHRSVAVLLTFVLVIVLFIVVILVVLPGLVQQIQEFASNLPEFFASFEQTLERALSEPLTFGGEPILINGEPFVPLEQLAATTGTENLDEVLQLENFDLMGALQTFLGSVGSLTGPAFSFLGGAFNTLINTSFLLMMMFYLMKDGGRFARRVIGLAPEDYRHDMQRLLQSLARVWNAYLRGQIILCVVIGVVVYLAALMLGLPNAIILGLIAGLLEFIPNLGPLLALIPAAFLALVSTSTTLPFLEGLPFMLVVIVVWTGIQNIEAVFLVPRVMGDSLDLHPFVVILGVLGGASIAGALGVILAAPFIASARVVSEYIYRKLFDSDPFPSDEPPGEEAAGEQKPALLVRLWRWLRQRFAGGSSQQTQPRESERSTMNEQKT